MNTGGVKENRHEAGTFITAADDNAGGRIRMIAAGCRSDPILIACGDYGPHLEVAVSVP